MPDTTDPDVLSSMRMSLTSSAAPAAPTTWLTNEVMAETLMQIARASALVHPRPLIKEAERQLEQRYSFAARGPQWQDRLELQLYDLMNRGQLRWEKAGELTVMS